MQELAVAGLNSNPVGVTIIPSALVPSMWEKVEDLIQDAVYFGFNFAHKQDLFQMLLAGQMQLWVSVLPDGGVKTALISEIINYPRQRVLNIVALGGADIVEHVKYLDDIMVWGVKNGCSSLDIIGREGWKKLLRPEGFELRNITLTKDLRHLMN